MAIHFLTPTYKILKLYPNGHLFFAAKYKILKTVPKRIRVPKVPFRSFDKLKNEIQNSILRFCFYFNKEDEIQIADYHFHV